MRTPQCRSGTGLPLEAPSCRNCPVAAACPIGGLPEPERDSLEPAIQRPHPLQRGDMLFAAGSPLDSFCVLRAGSMKRFVLDNRGDEHILQFNHPGDIPGLEDIGGPTHQGQVQALETSSICRIPLSVFDESMAADGGFRHTIYQRLSQHFSAVTEHALVLARGSTPERVAAFVVQLSRSQTRRGCSRCQFHFSMSRYDIANYLGMASESVSRVLTDFQEQGLLSVSRRGLLQIHDLEALQRLGGLSAGVNGRNRYCA